MHKINKIINIVINVIFYPLLAALLAAVILFVLGIKPYITMSGSMEPEVMTGSVCFVNTKANYEEVETGDVIAFQTALGGLVTHRVISVTEHGLETKGDNNESSDGISTTADNFRGQTVFSVPYLGYALKALQQPKNFIIVIIVVAGIFGLNIIDSYYTKKELQAMQDELETKKK